MSLTELKIPPSGTSVEDTGKRHEVISETQIETKNRLILQGPTEI